MTNKQLINARWRYTDNQLRKYYKRFSAVFDDIKQELVSLFKELDIDRTKLNSVVSSNIRRKYDRDKRDWKELGIITPYFQFLLDTIGKLTYSNLLKIYVMALYLKYQDREFDECKGLLTLVANDVYHQAEKDLNKKPGKDLTWGIIRDWAIVQTINVSLYDYLQVLNQTASEEASRMFINAIQQDLILEDSMLSKMIEKQLHRFISVKNDRFSGLLESEARQIGNMAYVQPFPNQKVRFVAEMDDKTTEMCRSLNGQIFNTKKWNVFKRYSELYKGLHKFSCKGLQIGLNLPPISDHFHWCRSTVIYQLNYADDQYLGEYNQMRRWIPEYLPKTFEEYVEMAHNKKGYRNHMRDLLDLRKHYERWYIRNDGRFQNAETREKLRHLSFDSYQTGYYNTRNELVGIKTGSGQVIENVSFHMHDRMLERDVDVDTIIDILENGTTTPYKRDPSITVYSNTDHDVSVTKEGNISTVI